MKKTRIAFEDIKAGDLLEVVVKEFGVKSVMTGIAFKLERMDSGVSRETIWWATSEGGMIVNTDEDSAIYRIEVGLVKFEDIQKGDSIKVTSKTGNVTTILEGVATAKVVEAISPYWVDEHGHILLFKMLVPETEQTIEILERAE